MHLARWLQNSNNHCSLSSNLTKLWTQSSPLFCDRCLCISIDVTWFYIKTIIKSILTVSINTVLAFIIVACGSFIWPPVTTLAFCLKSSIWYWILQNWLPRGTDFPPGKTLNATLTVTNALDLSFTHKVLPFLAFKARACSMVLGCFMPNLWLLFKYLVCCFTMLAIILSLFLNMWLSCTKWDSFESDIFPWGGTILPLAANLPTCSCLMGYWYASNTGLLFCLEIALLSLW